MDTKLIMNQFSQLSDYQKDMLVRIIQDYILQNEESNDLSFEVCPCCEKHAKINKAGFQNNKQRFKCNCCSKTFVYTRGRLNYWSHHGIDVWNKVMIDTLNTAPLRETAADINANIKNVFYMRHKIMVFLEQLVQNDIHLLSGIVEFDETYVNDAYKGRFQNSVPTGRKARKHGGKASKRGISSEKICILTASDRNGHEVIKAVGRAKPTSASILCTLSSKIRPMSICVNDGVYSYDKLIKACDLENRVVSDKSVYTPVYHLNTVNSIHREWKKIWLDFRGVSTKYLNRYLSLFTFIRLFMGMDSQEQFYNIKKQLKPLLFIAPIRIVKYFNLLSI